MENDDKKFTLDFPKGEQVTLETEGMEFKFYQESYKDDDDFEELSITVRNNGGDDFYAISTKEFALNNLQDLMEFQLKIVKMINTFSD